MYWSCALLCCSGVLISTASFPVLKSNRIFDGGAAGIEITNSAGEQHNSFTIITLYWMIFRKSHLPLLHPWIFIITFVPLDLCASEIEKNWLSAIKFILNLQIIKNINLKNGLFVLSSIDWSILCSVFYLLAPCRFFETPIYQSKLSSEYITHRPHRFTPQSFCFSAG